MSDEVIFAVGAVLTIAIVIVCLLLVVIAGIDKTKGK